MKTISENISLFFLIVVLAISPLQASYAAISNCSEMMSEMHFQEQSSEEIRSASESKQDCCHQNNCAFAQCASTVMAAIPSVGATPIEYIASNVKQIHNQLINSYFPSSIYRPPKY